MTPTEIVVVSRFHIELEGGGGDIHVTLPYSMVEPIKDMLKAGMQADRAGENNRWGQSLRNELEDAEVEVVTSLCESHLTVQELLAMRAGDVLPCTFNGTATVLSDGLPLFLGEVGQQRGRQVVKVREMLSRKTSNTLDAFVRKH